MSPYGRPPVVLGTGLRLASQPLSHRIFATGFADAPAGFPFEATLSDLAEHENAPVARFTARLLEYPTGHLGLAGDGWPFAHLLWPLAVGFLGLALAMLVDRLLGPATKRFRRSPKGTSA